MAGTTLNSYAINAKTAKSDLAKKFIDFLETEENTNLYTKTNGSLPAIPNATAQVNPAIQALADYQSENKTDPFPDQFWPNARVQQAHFDAVQGVLGGNLTIDEALQMLDAAYQQGA
jgi:raffinose/stachyose/melibiose transport system substrate-binding protein